MRPPKHLDDDARAIWNKFKDRIPQNDVAFDQLEQLAESWSLFRQASKDLRENGALVRLSNDRPVSNPSVQNQKIGIQNYNRMVSILKLDAAHKAKPTALPRLSKFLDQSKPKGEE